MSSVSAIYVLWNDFYLVHFTINVHLNYLVSRSRKSFNSNDYLGI